MRTKAQGRQGAWSDAADVLSDPTASDWLKRALLEALRRDPADAANDAYVLASILGRIA